MVPLVQEAQVWVHQQYTWYRYYLGQQKWKNRGAFAVRACTYGRWIAFQVAIRPVSQPYDKSVQLPSLRGSRGGSSERPTALNYRSQGVTGGPLREATDGLKSLNYLATSSGGGP